MTLCGKGHDNWSTWTSTDGTVHKYCKTCRQSRAKTYSERKKSARGSQARYDDILKHPLAYVLLCRKCHDKTGPSVYAMREMKVKKKGFL